MKCADGYRFQVLVNPCVLTDKLTSGNFTYGPELGGDFPEMLDYVPGTVSALIFQRAAEVTDIVLFSDQPKKSSLDKALVLGAAVADIRLSLQGLPVSELPVYEPVPVVPSPVELFIQNSLAPRLWNFVDKVEHGVRQYLATTTEQVRTFGYLRRSRQ
ncbi:MAG: hypothetical protein Q7R96_03170 [Nanoarchaeota archaeon]|nr:hypothetical protein [Nanoarchaeota archaeon]